MKRTFLARRNALLTSRSVSWGALVFAAIFFIVILRFFTPNFFLHLFAPAFKAADALAAESHALLSGFGDVAVLTQANEKLTSENSALASENQTLAKKVDTLSALLGASAPASAPSILAGVVARPPVSPYDTLILAVGKKGGVVAGMEAFADGGVPIGIVSSVLDDFSRVTLFSSPGMTTSAWAGHANIALTLTGEGAGAMSASVARAAAVGEGDIVFVPGPGMLPVGSVLRVDGNALSPSVTLRIMPAVNPSSLSWVMLRATGVVPTVSATSTVP